MGAQGGHTIFPHTSSTHASDAARPSLRPCACASTSAAASLVAVLHCAGGAAATAAALPPVSGSVHTATPGFHSAQGAASGLAAVSVPAGTAVADSKRRFKRPAGYRGKARA